MTSFPCIFTSLTFTSKLANGNVLHSSIFAPSNKIELLFHHSSTPPRRQSSNVMTFVSWMWNCGPFSSRGSNSNCKHCTDCSS
ncbi:hypothetical protein IQ07DRAFT_360399 [Pyrenochaeta sp. DS3sAY3a]|nr:hypothetical protein IQ07DRAFT_360399 [Pyrenochaeta sp. DS3sAY3a]